MYQRHQDVTRGTASSLIDFPAKADAVWLSRKLGFVIPSVQFEKLSLLFIMGVKNHPKLKITQLLNNLSSQSPATTSPLFPVAPPWFHSFQLNAVDL